MIITSSVGSYHSQYITISSSFTDAFLPSSPHNTSIHRSFHRLCYRRCLIAGTFLSESITFEDWDTIVVNWKMGWTGKYPIRFYSVTDALIPKMETKNGHYYINGIMVRARSLTLQGFENRQTAALKTRVIDPGVGDLPVPKVISESKK